MDDRDIFSNDKDIFSNDRDIFSYDHSDPISKNANEVFDLNAFSSVAETEEPEYGNQKKGNKKAKKYKKKKKDRKSVV